jgi:hypothetical protein
MVSAVYNSWFVYSLAKYQGDLAAAPAHIVQIGQNEQDDSRRYWAGAIAGRLIPFAGRLAGSFSTQEYLLVRTLWKDPELPAFDLQVPIMPIPEDHATIFSAACAIPVPIPISVMISWVFPKSFSLSKPTFVRLGSTNKVQFIDAKKVWNEKISWHPFLDQLNLNEDMKKAWDRLSFRTDSEVSGNLKGKRPDNSYFGYGRLIPYKGWTIVEVVVAPIHEGYGQGENLSVRDIHATFVGTYRALKAIGKREEEIGSLPIHEGNQEMMARIIGELESHMTPQRTQRTIA